MSEAELLRALVKTVTELAARVRHLEAAELLHNATQIQGVNVQDIAPANGDLLIFDSADNRWEPGSIASPPSQYAGLVRCTSTLNLTATWQDVPGVTKTLTIPSGGQIVLIVGVFDFAMQYTSSTVVLQGRLLVDGTAESGIATFQGDAPGERGTVSQAWLVNLAAGNRVIKLQARNSGTGTNGYCYATNTAMYWMRSDIIDES